MRTGMGKRFSTNTRNALEPIPEFPSPADFGWIKNNAQLCEPLWTMLPEAAASCQELCTASVRWAVVGCVSASKLPCLAQLYVLAAEIVPK